MNNYQLDDTKLEQLLQKIKKKKYKSHHIFGTDSVIYRDHELKLCLFHYQHRTNKCEKCHQEGFWNKKPLELLVHRKNKNPKDNSLSNIQLLCPNCYSQIHQEKIWMKLGASKMLVCVDCGKKFKKSRPKKIIDPCADIGSEKSDYVNTNPRVNLRRGEITRCVRCLEIQIQKKDYTRLNRIKKTNLSKLDNMIEDDVSITNNTQRVVCL